MRKIWVHRASSFSKEEKLGAVHAKMSPAIKLETMQLLREIYFKLHPKLRHEYRKGLRRYIKVIQQA